MDRGWMSVARAAETGNWAADNARGRALAADCLSLMRDQNSPVHLVRLMREMISADRCGGIEVGFVSELASAVMARAYD